MRACRVCELSKLAQNSHYGMLSSDVTSCPLVILINVVGRLPQSKSGNIYALLCVDAFTKFVWIFPVPQELGI
jgi:hypothetical protein